jgi:hypothetical protein
MVFMDKNFWSWLAGFIDGDGSFIVGIGKARTTRINFNPHLRISLAIQNNGRTAISVLETIKKNIGFGYINRKNWFESYNLKSLQAVEVAKKLYPFLRLKKEDCRIFLEVGERMKRQEHLTKNGLIEIIKLRDTMHTFKCATRKPLSYFEKNIKIRAPADKSESTLRGWQTRRFNIAQLNVQRI